MLGANNMGTAVRQGVKEGTFTRVGVSVEVRGQEQSSPGPGESTEEQGFQAPHLQHWAGPRRQAGWDPQQSQEPWSGRGLGGSEEEGKSPRDYPPATIPHSVHCEMTSVGRSIRGAGGSPEPGGSTSHDTRWLGRGAMDRGQLVARDPHARPDP